MPDLTGRILNRRYRVLRFIDSGGMSEVYVAEDLDGSSKLYAIKVLHENLVHRADLEDRFQYEIEVLRQLEHEGIVRVYDRFAEGGRPCMVLAFVDGLSLAALLKKEGALSLERALPIFKRILEALDYAHQSGVIHRDIKPSNILIDAQGHPLLCDFGIARPMGGRRRTATGTRLGTLYYMSPEQIRRPQEVDHRTDIYSAGVMLYETLTGRVPFDADDTASDYELAGEIVNAEPPDPLTLKPGIGGALSHVLLKALRKDPNRRYQGALDFWEAIEQAAGRAGEPGRPERDTDHPPVPPPPPPPPLPLRPPPSSPPPPPPTMPAEAGRVFVVYHHPTRGVRAVPVGFSWPALLGFGLPWLLAKGLLRQALLWLGAILVVWFMAAVRAEAHGDAQTMLGYLVAIGLLAIWALPALKGHAWLEANLQQRGFEVLAEVKARNADAAVARAMSATGLAARK